MKRSRFWRLARHRHRRALFLRAADRARFEFSLRMRRGVYSFDAYRGRARRPALPGDASAIRR